jgi:hypothetical protein
MSAAEDRLEKIAEGHVNQHKLDCWGDDGPLGKVRADIASLKSWGKGFIIASVVLQLLNSYQTWATKNGILPIPSARAESVGK